MGGTPGGPDLRAEPTAVGDVQDGIGIGCVETAEHAAVAAYAPAEIRGSAFGLLAAVQSFGNLAASGIADLLWTIANPSSAFTYLTGWMILAATILTRIPPRPTLAAIAPVVRGRPDAAEH